MMITDEMKRYYDNHLRCPTCYRKVVETHMSPPTPVDGVPYRDVINVVVCGECGWRGVVDKLKG